jgi:hypothetical protein
MDGAGAEYEAAFDRPSPPDGLTKAITEEAAQLQSQIRMAATAQFIRSTAWSRVSLVMNLVTAFLAGAAGVGTLAQSTSQVVAGTTALLAAALAAANSALGADKRAASASEAANGYIELRDSLRQLVRLDMCRKPPDEVRTELATITGQLHAVNKGVEPPGRMAWNLARRRLRREGARRRGEGAESGRRV